MGSVSQTLLVFNSSINFLLYPALFKDFRSIFKDYLRSKTAFFSRTWRVFKGITRSDTDDTEVGREETNSANSLRSSPANATLAEGQQSFNNQSILLQEFQTHDVEVSFNEGSDTGYSSLSSALVIFSASSSIRRTEVALDETSSIDP